MRDAALAPQGSYRGPVAVNDRFWRNLVIRRPSSIVHVRLGGPPRDGSGMYGSIGAQRP